MEIPPTIHRLYRHWSAHTTKQRSMPLAHVIRDTALRTDILLFIKKRMAVWEKKVHGEAPPLTDDPVLARYRFCNVLRELDRHTIEYHTLLNPLRDNFPLWLMNMFYCRMVARPETVRRVGLLSKNEAENASLLERLSTHPSPRYGTPYVFPISTIMRSDTPTRELFITHHLPQSIPRVADEVRTWRSMPVSDGLARILSLFGVNLRFLWTEVLIDVAYQFPEHVTLYGRFPIGPGAIPTFARLCGTLAHEQCAEALGAARIPSGATVEGAPVLLSAENWEGIGCEYRKYTNLRAGHGRKRLFAA